MRSCDDYIDDPSAPEALRRYLSRARMPAHGMLDSSPYPRLFATYAGGRWRGFKKGDRVRVVMASRMGDVGITKQLDSEVGYQARCAISDLSNFSEEP